MKIFKNISIEVKAIAITLIIIVIGCSAFVLPNYIKTEKKKQEIEKQAKECLVSIEQYIEACDYLRSQGSMERLAVYQLHEKSIPVFEMIYMSLYKKMGEGNEITKRFGNCIDILKNKQKADKQNYDISSQEEKNMAQTFCEITGLHDKATKCQASSLVLLVETYTEE